MGRKTRIALAVLLVLLLGALISTIVFVREIDPVYEGKRMSAWTTNLVTWRGPSTPEALALQRFGSNSTPMLIKMLRARDSSLELKVAQLLATQKVVRLNIRYQPASVSQNAAITACGVLGAEVRGAIPSITTLILDYPARMNNGGIALRGVHVLAAMGPEGIPGLAQATASPDAAIRLQAVQLLGTAPFTGTPEALAALQKCAGTNDPALRDAAALALELIKQRQAQHVSPSALRWSETAATPVESPASVWDVARGVRVTATSGLYPGFQATDVFGSRKSNGGTGETGTIVFQDGKPDGFLHFLEWETPSPVTLRSFGAIGFHQAADEVFERSFRTFRLFAREDAGQPYQLVWSEDVPVPYGQGHFATMRYLFRNFETPLTARQYRAEFVQNGAGSWFGPRVIALYGFTNTLNVPMAVAALANRDPDTQREARGIFEQWARESK